MKEEKLKEVKKTLNNVTEQLNEVTDVLCSIVCDSEIKQPSVCKAASDEAVSTEEAARMLKVSVPTIRKEISRGNLKAVRVGRAYRFSKNYLMSKLQ